MNSITIEKFPKLGYACDEAFNTLCTNLTFSGEHVKKIMITSTFANEGKSFIAMNIMRTLAKFGKRVVLVDADLRKSDISSHYKLVFSSEYKVGLAHMLAGMATGQEIVYKTNISNAWIVPMGQSVSNPLPLLNSPKFCSFLNQLTCSVDYIIIDTPPVGTVIDAAQIAKYCDGALIAVGYDNVRHQELIGVKRQLEQTGCPVLGTILNQVALDNYVNRKYYNKSYYNHYAYSPYSSDSTKKKGAHKSWKK